MSTTSSRTHDGLEIIDRLYFAEPDPERDARARAYDLALDVAQAVYDLREATGLPQAEFAVRVGLSAEQISDLEDADFSGDPVATLHQIAAALDHELKLTVIPKQAA